MMMTEDPVDNFQRTETITEVTAGSVLVASDSSDSRANTSMTFAAAGFAVHEASDGATALAIARLLRPTCVLIDTNLPDMSAPEVCRALRSHAATSSATIVVRSPLATSTDKAEAFLTGADDYIVTPVAPSDLVTRVRYAIHQSRGTVAIADEKIDDVEAMLLEILETNEDTVDGALPEAEHLTPRQVEILKRLLAGERVPRIARDLFVTQSTVRNHLSLIYRRFAVHSQDELLHLLRVRRSPRQYRFTSYAG